MKTLRPYPEYKACGAEWLGEITARWLTKRLKFVTAEPLKYGANESAEGNDPNLPRFIRITDIKDDGTLHDDTFKSLPEEVARPFLLKQGDLLLALSGATVGKTFMYRESWGRACQAGYLIRCRVNPAVARPEFVAYFATTASYWGWLSSVFIQATIQNVSAEKYANLLLPIPPLDEQSLIVRFLDRETSRIDVLVAKKERLIALLQEKRTALISHAVNKGLNPNAPMKDSGIPWLGQIPAHWQLGLLKRYAKIRYGLGQPPPELPDGPPLIRATNIKSGKILEADMLRIDPAQVPESRDAILSAGEIIVVRSGAYTGDSAIIPSRYQGAISGYDMVVTVKEGFSPYVAWQLLSPEVRQLQFGLCCLRAAQPHLNAEELQATIVAVPPPNEQRVIAHFLDRETAKLDALLAKIRTSIKRLQEYRTALISAAVTGKIDVRQPPASASQVDMLVSRPGA